MDEGLGTDSSEALFLSDIHSCTQVTFLNRRNVLFNVGRVSRSPITRLPLRRPPRRPCPRSDAPGTPKRRKTLLLFLLLLKGVQWSEWQVCYQRYITFNVCDIEVWYSGLQWERIAVHVCIVRKTHHPNTLSCRWYGELSNCRPCEKVFHGSLLWLPGGTDVALSWTYNERGS